MATAAFRSTTRRTSIGDSFSSSSSSSSSNRNSSFHRRSRSVSRFSHRILPDDTSEDTSVNRKGKFVNTVRGSGVPEISLDDLAIELFSSSDFGDSRGRQQKKVTSADVNDDTTSCRRRGRSVSRRGSRVGELRNNLSDKNGGNNINERVSDGNSRRRRSLSVVSHSRLISDSENEHFLKNRSRANPKDLSTWNKERPSVQKPTNSNQQSGLRRCSSQKDFLRSNDGYSSYASTLTDDEGIDALYGANRVEPAIRVSYAQPKGTAGNCDGVQPTDSDVLKVVSTVRKNYRTKLEQSEKRKQELLAEILLEEERGNELKEIVGELRSSPKETAAARRLIRGRKRSKDRNKASKQLVEEAEKIIEDFISSVEETDISSFDGERSDTSSVVGGTIKPLMMPYGEIENFRSPVRSDLLPSEMDGVVLPWLKWETSNDGAILGSDNKQRPATPKTVLQDAMKDATAEEDLDRSVTSKSSRGSWRPGVVNSFSVETREFSRAVEVDSCKSQLLSQVPRRSRVDIGEYLKPPSNEDFLSERWKQRERLNSGGLLICNSGSPGTFFL